MTSYLVAAVLLGFVLFLTAVQRKQSLGAAPARKGRFESRPPLTRKEQAMYLRLAEAFPPPGYLVFAAVNPGALLEPKGGASLHKYAQRRAGLVLLDKSFLVLAIIEVDDNPAHGAASDSSADALFKSAGYKVLRYRKLPDVERLRVDVSKHVYSAGLPWQHGSVAKRQTVGDLL
jgi:hypothetical protein